ncbi:MAG: tripartite tricarboxylate transporter substrate binding protein [Betaproteobacteria bacterium]|nr:tripartite tricarboxylate transporter substrate binding protein [Betaproteobacteria bacterium]
MATVNWSRPIIAGVAAVAFAHAAVTAQAQTTYPVKSVRMLLGFVPGGLADFMARLVGEKLAESWGQQVIVENRPGASGKIAAELTAKAAPDGYTLLTSNNGLTTNPLLFDKYPLDPLKDFTAVSLVAISANILVVHPSVPAKSMKTLIALARSRPLTQGTAGVGSPGHLAGELLQQLTQYRFVHIPYKGTGALLNDLIGGHIDLSFPTLLAGQPFIQSGKLRALGITSAKRSTIFPDVPTISESGVPGFETVGWYGVLGPAGMPKDVVSRLSAELARIFKTPEVRKRMLDRGAEPIGSSSEEFAAYLAEDTRKWAKVIKAANIRPSQL